MSTFVQFRYCPLCRLNHKKGKKHVLSKRHQDTIQNVLAKFSKRIAEAKATLLRPSVKDLEWTDADRMFWCYCCQQDVSKHRRNVTAQGDCVMEYGGMLEHLTRDDHVENTIKFLRENKMNLTRTSEFVLTSDLLLTYLEKVEEVSSKMLCQKADAIKEAAYQLRNQEAIRHKIVAAGFMQQNLLQEIKQQERIPSVKEDSARFTLTKPSVDAERGKKTIQAFGEGLTVIDRTNEDDTLGNIYSNALPPWLQSITERGDIMSDVIGPTMEDLEKHSRLEKKKQLPAGRVGAKFDHKTDQAESWLPNFGGVWRQGRRTNSVEQFNKCHKERLKPCVKRSVLSSEPSLASISNTVKQFSRPKIPRRTSTVTSSMDLHVKSNNFITMDDAKKEVQFSLSSAHSLLSDEVGFNALTIPSTNSVLNDPLMSKTYSHSQPSSSYTSVHNISSVLGAEEIGSCSTVTPYVRKRRGKTQMGMSSTLSPYLSVHSADSYNMHVDNHLSITQSSEALSSNSNTRRYHPHPSNIYDTDTESQNSSDSLSIIQTAHLFSQYLGGHPFRLLATPVLNKQKK